MLIIKKILAIFVLILLSIISWPTVFIIAGVKAVIRDTKASIFAYKNFSNKQITDRE